MGVDEALGAFESASFDARFVAEVVAVGPAHVPQDLLFSVAEAAASQLSKDGGHLARPRRGYAEALSLGILEQTGHGVLVRTGVREHMARSAGRGGRFASIVRAYEDEVPLLTKSTDFGCVVWRTRTAVHRGEAEQARLLLESIDVDFRRWWEHRGHPVVDILSNPIDLDWLGALPEEIAVPGISRLLEASFFDMRLGPKLGELHRRLDGSILDAQGGRLRFALADDLLARGDPEAALSLLGPGPKGDACRAVAAFLRGEGSAAAARDFLESLETVRRQSRRRSFFWSDFTGALGVMALIHTGEPDNLGYAARLCDDARKGANSSRFDDIFADLARAVEASRARKPTRFASQKASGIVPVHRQPVELFFAALADAFVLPDRKEIEPGLVRALEEAKAKARAAGYELVAEQTAALVAKLLRRPSSTLSTTAVSFCEALTAGASWRRAIDMLGAIGGKGEAATGEGPSPGQRLAWRLLSDDGGKTWDIRPVVQAPNKAGGWTKGRALPRTSWSRPEWRELMTPADVEALLALSVEPENPGGARGAEAAASALAGHPMLFCDGPPAMSVDIVRGKPVVRVENRGTDFLLSLSPCPSRFKEGWALHRASPGLFEVTRLTPAQREVGAVLGEEGVAVPAGELGALTRALESLCAVVEVHGEEEMMAGPGAEEVRKPDMRLRLRCYPYGRGLLARLAVTPLGAHGPQMRPGHGPASVMAHVEGRIVRATRDLTAEARRVREFTAVSPVFSALSISRGDDIARAPAPEDALELLEELADGGADVLLEWPQGEILRVSKPLAPSCLRFAVARREEWFEISGEAVVDEGRVVALRTLLAALRVGESRRWISVGEGLYLRLTQALRRQLEVLAKADLGGSDDGVIVSDAAAASIAPSMNEAGFVDADPRWRELEGLLSSAQREETPVPRGFRAELRDYQRQGYSWMMRLARLGFGALLADDMGVGKTVQALAVLCARADKGPSLVVAPTSVCSGWLQEAARFAPQLKAIAFEGEDRRRVLTKAKAFDLYVVSYGLLIRDAEVLTRVRWGTAILDEAQAIKNPDAMRSKTAYLLRADFKLAMTGTPVENRLGDLWSVMHCLNPGLLGTRQGFAAHFEAPAQKEGFEAIGEPLRRLTAPFVLRRCKQDVLKELPPRTEIVRKITLSEEERALYELERRRVAELLETVDAAAKPVVILSALTRLRRLCCHPSLVEPRLQMGGAKLEALARLVRDLEAGGHRALVFSQFVDCLALVRRRLEQQGVEYRYLDGSTPAQKRAEAVRDFQEGRGRVFLISLKAGGVGLNLTAADYVIHVDPWWNPAAQDQASDRAHRMGQKRPVTVYKLVAEDTIEEKVTALHGHKRQLAEGLLEDADRVARLDASSLISLIRDLL